ncbi:DUF5946 family protein [Bacillus marasmi]|uniref:DUF5946 family protein n=1 Tax=Bacillus marasmi TaxID=1926279 RepID=UPI0011CB4399|nr:DUF5946 family protein [Bacillus marasmi]
MVQFHTVMEKGRCSECGAREIDGHSCHEMFQYPLVWEHNDPKLYDLHFWLVSCYMLQHPSNFTKEGYDLMKTLFIEAYENNWETSYILKKNRELVAKIGKITNPLPSTKRQRNTRKWAMTIEDVFLCGEENAINKINQWKDSVRVNLNGFLQEPY